MTTTSMTSSPSRTPEPYWYLATVYSRHPKGLDVAFQEACRVTADLMRLGLNVVSPIAHSHPISRFVGKENDTWDFWKKQDQPLMDHACGIIVVRMEGWQESVGIRYELEEFRKAGKPILYVDP